jgi:hypothetical protein
MDYSDNYSDPLNFDQSLIMSKLGYDVPYGVAPTHNATQSGTDMDNRIKIKLLENRLAEQEKKNSVPVREHFVGGCDCDGMKSKRHRSSTVVSKVDSYLGMSVKNILILLVVVMAALCIVQYFTYQHEMHEIMSMMYVMMNNNARPSGVDMQSGNIQQSSATNQQSTYSSATNIHPAAMPVNNS